MVNNLVHARPGIKCKHLWCSVNITAFQAVALGSIPGGCRKYLLPLAIVWSCTKAESIFHNQSALQEDVASIHVPDSSSAIRRRKEGGPVAQIFITDVAAVSKHDTSCLEVSGQTLGQLKLPRPMFWGRCRRMEDLNPWGCAQRTAVPPWIQVQPWVLPGTLYIPARWH